MCIARWVPLACSQFDGSPLTRCTENADDLGFFEAVQTRYVQRLQAISAQKERKQNEGSAIGIQTASESNRVLEAKKGVKSWRCEVKDSIKLTSSARDNV